MNSTELAVLRQRCDRGETFTAEEVEYLLDEIESLWGEMDMGALISGFAPELMPVEPPDVA